MKPVRARRGRITSCRRLACMPAAREPVLPSKGRSGVIDQTGRLRDSELVEAIAVRVVELLGGPPTVDPGGLVDAATLARELGVERDWVYDHAAQLGSIRLGGPRGRLRFDLASVREKLGGTDPSSWRPPRRTPRRSTARPKAPRPPLRHPARSNPVAKRSDGALGRQAGGA
jgi:hypothetical protein